MLKINNKPIDISIFTDKTKLMKFETNNIPVSGNASILWRYDDDAELFQLQCIVDYLRSCGCNHIELKLPYIPNARMDRVKSGEMFTLKTFANIINNMHFDRVVTFDAHSNVSLALINNIENEDPDWLVNSAVNRIDPRKENTILFFPDEGAMKRYSHIADQLKLPYVYGIKMRNYQTHKIESLDVVTNNLPNGADGLKKKYLLIVDDICSKGDTAHMSALKLRELGAIYVFLCVSHLENTVWNGPIMKDTVIKEIFSSDSIYRPDLSDKRTKIVPAHELTETGEWNSPCQGWYKQQQTKSPGSDITIFRNYL